MEYVFVDLFYGKASMQQRLSKLTIFPKMPKIVENVVESIIDKLYSIAVFSELIL